MDEKIHVVFNDSAKTVSGVSLNNQLLVEPTVHLSLNDVLLHFWKCTIALMTHVSRMYHTVFLPNHSSIFDKAVFCLGETIANQQTLFFTEAKHSFIKNAAVIESFKCFRSKDLLHRVKKICLWESYNAHSKKTCSTDSLQAPQLRHF